jgi:hypothetical protein
MLIDFVTTCASIVKINSNYPTTGSSNLLSTGYSIKNLSDIKSWKVENNGITSVAFTFISSSIKNLKSVDFGFNTDFQPYDMRVKIETSIDYANWVELPYKKDSKYLYKEVKIDGVSNYYNYTLKQAAVIPAEDVPLLEYAFTKTNEYNKDINDVYDNLEWKFLRFTMSNLPPTEGNALSFSNISVMIEDEVAIDLNINNVLELKSTMFVQSKIFEEYNFIPDMLKNFMQMIEAQNLPHNYVNIAKVDLTAYKSTSTLPDGIGGDIIEVDTVVYEDTV